MQRRESGFWSDAISSGRANSMNHYFPKLRWMSLTMNVLLGFIRHTWQPASINLRNMDCIHILLPRDSHLGGHHRHRVRDALLEAHRAPLGPDPSHDFLRRGEL